MNTITAKFLARLTSNSLFDSLRNNENKTNNMVIPAFICVIVKTHFFTALTCLESDLILKYLSNNL